MSGTQSGNTTSFRAVNPDISARAARVNSPKVAKEFF